MEMGKRVWRKGAIISVAAVVLGALTLNGWALNPKEPKEDKNTVLVTVEDVNITRGDVDQKIDTFLKSQGGALPPDQLAKIKSSLDQKVLENMIIEALLDKAVKEQQITLENGEVNKVIESMKTSLPPETDFKAYLKGIGFTEKALAQTITKNLKIKKLLEAQVASLPTPTDEEIQAFYDEHPEEFKTPEGMEVRHILVMVSPKDDEATHKEKRAKAESIRSRLVDKKEDFATVAAEESDGPSKAKGGNIGLVTKGRTVKPFEDAVFSQKVGEIGPIVETQFGYHIIQVMKHQDAGSIPLVEAKPSIKEHLASKQKQEAVNAYIDSLRSKAKIVYHHQALEGTNPPA
jgi:peptidyl-prolyl cis-trans isomerase C